MIQKIGAKAVTGTFKTVAREVAEAEANLQPVQERQTVRAARTWIDLLTLPADNPLQARKAREHRRFKTPLLRLREAARQEVSGVMERIQPYVIPPWVLPIEVQRYPNRIDLQAKIEKITKNGVVLITTAAEMKGRLRYGGSIITRTGEPTKFIREGGTRAEENPYTAELAATAITLELYQRAASAVRR
jgi:hypothetical protein